MPERFIGGASGGVPERIFVPKFQEVVAGKSGELLYCHVSNDYISIEPPKREFKFHARRSLAGRETVLFNLKTKIGDPQYPLRHPDIFAAELVKRSIEYFDEQGPSISRFMATWVGTSSDNYNCYMKYLNELEKENPTLEDREDAARQTWTGQLAHSLGFTEIEKMTGSTGVWVTFKKPEV